MLYHKINSLYKRDQKGRFTDEFSQSEFEYLYENEWEGTEKIDGTNIRIMYDGAKIEIGGRTERAQIPSHLYNYLFSTFTFEKMKEAFGRDDDANVILFGEGFGNKIQKGEKYLGEDVGFALFDIRVGPWWLLREDITAIAKELCVYEAEVVYRGSLGGAERYVRGGAPSLFGKTTAEGLVLRPKVELFCRNGSRIITKIKTKDYQWLNGTKEGE